MREVLNAIPAAKFAAIRAAVIDQSRVSGLTHKFYRYPARFSPSFVRACINLLTKPGDLVLDPYMGGGTTVVEAMVAGRRSVGSDINELAVFVAAAKVSKLSAREKIALANWANETVLAVRCSAFAWSDSKVPRNMHLPETRWLRKSITLLLNTLDEALPTEKSRRFARCVLLNAGQWALNGRKCSPSAAEFRTRVAASTHDMLSGLDELNEGATGEIFNPLIRKNDAESIASDIKIRRAGLADLVVTSPPYPGVHMLYHRWQVDGRKETDAPYWISGTKDGAGTAYYNFAYRHRQAEDRYYEKATRAFSSIRQVMRQGALMAQLVAFSEPKRQLPRYLDMLEEAGFAEARARGRSRVWRAVPGRKWHANSKGKTASSREVLLVHAAM